LHVVSGEAPLNPRGRRIGKERLVSVAETDIVVVGMGPGGEDAAAKLAEAGLHVTGVEAMPQLLPVDEPEAGELLESVFSRECIVVRTRARAERVSHDGQVFTMDLADGETLTAQHLLGATGRRARVAALGVAPTGWARLPGAWAWMTR
jgi:pyruvate/2-oxoglutarate dehydrogenase complex dihydrolipoamide dehydrogenase (E3) component